MAFSKSAFEISPQIRLVSKFLITPISESTSQQLIEMLNALDKNKKVAEPYTLYDRLIKIDAHNNHALNLSTSLRLFLQVIRVRGLPRWLISKFGATEELRNLAYKINRWQILRILVTDYMKSKYQYLSKVQVLDKISTDNEQNVADSAILVNASSAMKIGIKSQVCFSLGKESRIVFFADTKSSKLEKLFTTILNKRFLNRRFVRKYQHFAELIDNSQIELNGQLKKIFNIDLENWFKNRKIASILPGANENYDSVNFRTDKYIKLENVELWHQRFIIKDNLWLVSDSTYNPKYGFVAGISHFIETSKKSKYIKFIEPGQRNVQIEIGILLSGRADENWFHFIFDTLARLQFIEDLAPEIPLLIRDDLPVSSMNLLQQLTNRQFIELEPETIYSVKELFVVSARGMIYDNKVEGTDARVDIPNAIRYLVEKSIDFPDSPENASLPARVFLTRKSAYRNLLNEMSIIKRLRGYGFENIDTDGNFIKKQQDYFRQAEVLVTPGGAVLGNLIFMSEGRKVVVLRSWYGGDLNLWRDLCSVLGHEYFEIVGIPTFYGFNVEKRLHSNYFIPLSYLNFLSNI